MLGSLDNFRAGVSRKTFLQMLLVQAVTVMETYLSDTLISNVLQHESAQEKLLNSKQLGIGEQKFTLKDAWKKDDFANRALFDHLRRISYHDIKRVQKYYQIGLRLDFSFTEHELNIIHDAVLNRHHCVHRNGKTPTGNPITINREMIEELIQVGVRMVNKIEEKLPL